MTTKTLLKEREAFDAMRSELEEHHMGKYAVILGDDLVGSYDTFDSAVRAARSLSDKGPYLIRRVGEAPEMTMPASVAFQVATHHAPSD